MSVGQAVFFNSIILYYKYLCFGWFEHTIILDQLIYIYKQIVLLVNSSINIKLTVRLRILIFKKDSLGNVSKIFWAAEFWNCSP